MTLREQIVETERRHVIAGALEKHGIPLTDISFDPGATTLIHKPTGEYFVFGNGKLSDSRFFRARYSRMLTEGDSSFGEGTIFNDLYEGFFRWCDNLRSYLKKIDEFKDAVDPFVAAARSFNANDVISRPVSNDRFSASERVTIIAQIEELKRHIIANGTVTDNNLALLNEKMDYLIESSERLGKKDWQNILISVMFSIVISGLFAPDRARELMDYGVGLFVFILQSRRLL